MKNSYLPFDPIAALAGDKVLQKVGDRRTREVKILPYSGIYWFNEYRVFADLVIQRLDIKRNKEALERTRKFREALSPKVRCSLNSVICNLRNSEKVIEWCVPCVINAGTKEECLTLLGSKSLTMSHPRNPDIAYGWEDYAYPLDLVKHRAAELYRQQLRFERERDGN